VEAYLKTVEELLTCPVRENRTGVDTLGKVVNLTEYNTNYGTTLNAVSSKSLPLKSVLGELRCFIQGKTSAADFGAAGCNVWYENANEHGVNPNAWLSNTFRKGTDDLGPIYGAQWRRWKDTVLFECEELIADDVNRGPISATTERQLKQEQEHKMFRHYIKLGYRLDGTYSKQLDTKKVTVFVLYREVDQLKNAVDTIIKSPNSRRVLVLGWNPAVLEQIALPACHVLQQYLCTELMLHERVQALHARVTHDVEWYGNERLSRQKELTVFGDWIYSNVSKAAFSRDVFTHEVLDSLNVPRHRLDLIMFQRSADFVLGSPFNIASYDMMLNKMARVTNTAPGSLFYLTGDTHIYVTHLDAAREQIERGPHEENRGRFLINPIIKTLEDLENSTADDYKFVGYKNKGKLENPTPMAI